MPVRWTDVSNIPFNALTLLEPAQIEWLPGWVTDSDMGLALAANPTVAWYVRHAARSARVREWLDRCMARPAYKRVRERASKS